MKAYLDMCPAVEPMGEGWSSQVNEGRFERYIERYGAVVVLSELLNQFAVRCVRGASGTAPSTHYVPALITGLRVLNPRRITQLTGRVSVDGGAGRVEVFATLGPDAQAHALATITVLSLTARQP